jgi:hypothetical protein
VLGFVGELLGQLFIIMTIDGAVDLGVEFRQRREDRFDRGEFFIRLGAEPTPVVGALARLGKKKR